jgi:cytochrome c2
VSGLTTSFALVLATGLLLNGCQGDETARRAAEIGDVEAGERMIRAAGCGNCHLIPGIDQARGLVGPPLDHMARRKIIAGVMQNTPANMITWVMNPQQVVPGNAMPDMGLDAEQARDITAYLYTLD